MLLFVAEDVEEAREGGGLEGEAAGFEGAGYEAFLVVGVRGMGAVVDLGGAREYMVVVGGFGDAV